MRREVVYEFESDTAPDEVRVILKDGSLNVLWPLPEGRCRWSFQWPQADEEEFPHKERRAVWFEDRRTADRTREHLEGLIQERAPWFAGKPTQVEWAANVQFRRYLAARFGQGRCWIIPRRACSPACPAQETILPPWRVNWISNSSPRSRRIAGSEHLIRGGSL